MKYFLLSSVDIDLGSELVELHLTANTHLEPEAIPVFVIRKGVIEKWSDYQVSERFRLNSLQLPQRLCIFEESLEIESLGGELLLDLVFNPDDTVRRAVGNIVKQD